MAFTAKILSWRFRLLKRRPTKEGGGGGGAGTPGPPPAPPLATPLRWWSKRSLRNNDAGDGYENVT